MKLEHGFCYLCAIMDWFSRYVIAWETSETLDTSSCIAALKRVLEQTIPQYHNSDQGSQFTSAEYTDILKSHDIQVSMDGRGRCFDNIFTERLWRTVKYEDIYLKSYRTIREARTGLTDYFQSYNTRRRHQSLNRQTPATIYFNHEYGSLHNTKTSNQLQHKNEALSPGVIHRSLSRQSSPP